MTARPDRVAVLWTGGKDCALALDSVRRSGAEIELVTFAPPGAAFRAHPPPVLGEQASALSLPWRVVEVTAPYEDGYVRALRRLVDEGVRRVVTGDIDRVDGRPNWIRERAAGLPLAVATPLWGRDRESLLADLSARGFVAVVSCTRPPLAPSLCGRVLDAAALDEIRRAGADLSGENGEYHTLVVDGPGFAWPLVLDAAPTTGDDGLTTLAVRAVRRGDAARR